MGGDVFCVGEKQVQNLLSGAIAKTQPDEFRWMAAKHTALIKVTVL